jgi:hypothetical protein
MVPFLFHERSRVRVRGEGFRTEEYRYPISYQDEL